MKLMAGFVAQIKQHREELLGLNVGTVPDTPHAPTFQESRRPITYREYMKEKPRDIKPPIHGEARPTPEQVNEQWEQATATLSGFANTFPTIYALLQQDKLDTLAKSTDATAALKVVKETLTTTYDKASEARGMIMLETGIKYSDLTPIHQQLFGGTKTGACTYSSLERQLLPCNCRCQPKRARGGRLLDATWTYGGFRCCADRRTLHRWCDSYDPSGDSGQHLCCNRDALLLGAVR